VHKNVIKVQQSADKRILTNLAIYGNKLGICALVVSYS